jgi:type II secretory pathway pseudopilin PulG
MKRKPQAAGFTFIEILILISTLGVLAVIAFFSYSFFKMKAYDATAQGDLRQAYYSTMAFFIDNPKRTLTEPGLSQYGFQSSPNVIMSIIDGSPTSLFLLFRHTAPGAQVYILYSNGIDSSGAPDHIWMAQWAPEGQAFSNLLTVSQTSAAVQSGESGQKANSLHADLLEKCNLLARSALGQAYDAAQSFFKSNPGDTLTKDLLISYGYNPHENVNLTIIDGSPSRFSMSAVFNIPGATNFGVDGSGSIIPQS